MSKMLKDYYRLSGNGGNVKRGFMIIMLTNSDDPVWKKILTSFSPSAALFRRYVKIAKNWDSYTKQEKLDIIAATKTLISTVSWGTKILIWIA